MKTLAEKQAYYVYPDGAPRYLAPPALPREVSEAMKAAERECPGIGERYRFLWMGCSVVRKAEFDENPIVKGDKRACMLQPWDVYGDGSCVVLRLQPRKLYIRKKEPNGYIYTNMDGHKVRVARADQVPVIAKQGLAVADFNYVEYGHLEWRIEQRIFGQPLDPFPLFPGEDWMCIQTIKSADGFYHEPSVLHVQDLVKREWQNRNLRIKDVVIAEYEEKMTAQEEREKAEDIEARRQIGEIVDDVFDHAERAPRSVSQYRDETGAAHTLWEDSRGDGHAQIDFTI